MARGFAAAPRLAGLAIAAPDGRRHSARSVELNVGALVPASDAARVQRQARRRRRLRCSQDRLCIPGEPGIRREDTVVVGPDGCENLAPNQSGSPEEPAVV